MRAPWAGLIAVVLVLSSVAAAGGGAGRPVLRPTGTVTAAPLRLEEEGAAGSIRSAGTSHVLTVAASNATTLAGLAVNFTATVVGVTLTQVEWWWGDGSTSTEASNSASHVYQDPGIYLVYAEGTNASVGTFDNLGSLLRFAVLDSYENDALGNQTQVQGSVLANDSSVDGAQAVLPPGGWLQVSNWVTNLPNNPQWTLESPQYRLGPSAAGYANLSTILAPGENLSGATVSWSNTTPEGSYTLNFSVPAMNSDVAPVAETWTNFTFTVFVATGGAAPVSPLPTSPHNGTLEVYDFEAVSSSQMTLDPALADDPTDGPILQNFYQTLIVYNGSLAGPQPSDFVPDLATCVPGSAQCVSLYNSTLVAGDNWTFVIDPRAAFYNATTGAAWSVYPNDVAFSFARTCLLANAPSGFENFQLCQTLLPPGSNASWDGGLHAPWNNTPAQILAGISLNNSLYCTPQMEDGVDGNGCITFDTEASGTTWPEFLEFLESTDGGAILSCSWAASEGLGLPGWSDGSKCYPAPPGAAGNPNPVPGPEAWDTYEATNGFSGLPTNALRFHALGSGPYYLASFDPTTGYTLAANPDWGGTTCQGGSLDGCLPSATAGGHSPTYLPNVTVHFETSNGPGLAALANGTADLIDTSGGGGNAGYAGNGSTILSEVRAGLLQYIVGPAVTVDYDAPVLAFNATAASAELGSNVTLPGDAFQDLNFRQFVETSYPHLSSEQNGCIVDGILYCFSIGGAIPLGLGDYYPTNISWPLANADANPQTVGSAAWWWSQTESDSLVGAACSPSSPCTFPLPAIPGQVPDYDLWAAEMENLSQGAIRATVVTVSFGPLLEDTVFAPPGNATYPLALTTWAPDYFDPSDYANPFYLPSYGYYASDLRFLPELTQTPYVGTCSGPAVDPTVTTACQGTAYTELVSLVDDGNSCAAPTCSAAQRALDYNMAERIASDLGLYVDLDQQAAVYAFAPWIDPSSLLLNPDRNNVYGGTTSDQPFFFVRYATDIPQGYQLRVSLQTPSGASTASLAPLSRPMSAVRSFSGGPTLEAGEAFLLLVSVTGGTGVYHYIWNGLPDGCASTDAAVLTCRPDEGGNVSLSVTVIDSSGATGTSNGVALDIAPRVTITSFVVSPTQLDLGASVSFAVTAQGGIGTFTFAYVGLPPGCSTSDLATFECVPTQAGQYAVTATVTDSIGLVAIASVEIDVVAPSGGSHATFLGLPGNDGYALLAGLALAAILVGVVSLRRRSRPPPAGTRPGAGSVGAPFPGPGTGGDGGGGPGPSPALGPSASGTLAGRPGGVPTGPTPSATVPCPHCGAPNRPEAKYCDQCGSSVPQ